VPTSRAFRFVALAFAALSVATPGAGALTDVLANTLRPTWLVFRADGKREFVLSPVVSKKVAGFSGTIRW
jgi:hypothetical protein